MVEFLTTMIQTTATIVGFIVAFSIGLYPLKRQRREERTEQLRNALIDFKDAYHDVIRSVSLIAHDGGVTTKEYLKDADLNFDEVEQRIEKDKDQTADSSAVIWRDLYIIRKHLEKINAETDFLLTSDEIDTVDESIRRLYSYFNVRNEDNKQFYYELSNIVDESKIPEGYYHDSVYSSGSGASNPEERLKQWIIRDSDGRHRNWAGYGMKDSGLSGKNLFSIGTLLEYLHQDWEKIQRRTTGTLLGYDPQIKKILIGILGMTFTGILIPFLFIIPAPAALMIPLSSEDVLWANVGILVSTSVLFAYLLFQIYDSINVNTDVRKGL